MGLAAYSGEGEIVERVVRFSLEFQGEGSSLWLRLNDIEVKHATAQQFEHVAPISAHIWGIAAVRITRLTPSQANCVDAAYWTRFEGSTD
jgi:hypothetical protein